MPLLAHLQIDSHHISLEAPERAISIQLANQVAYDNQRLALISYGKTADEMKAEIGEDWRAFLQRTTFSRIFDPETTGPVFDYQVIELLFQRLNQQISPGRLRNLIPLFKVPREIKVEIQDYERLSLGRQRELEYYLQDFERTNRLWINGAERTISLHWRVLQTWIGWILRLLVPSLMLFMGFLAIFTRQEQDVSQLVGTAAGWIAASVLAYFLGTILWMLICRKKLPHGYLRYQLRSSGSLMRRPTRWLADKLL